MKKYELTTERNNAGLYRIRALIDIPDVVDAGDLGGFVESEDNLSHEGSCWIFDDACAHGNARVFEGGQLAGEAHAFGNAKIYGNALATGHSRICDDACVCDEACVFDDVWVYGKAKLFGIASVGGHTQIYGNGRVASRKDVLWITGLGSATRTTTAYKSTEGIEVVCGCFHGSLDEFRKQVQRTYPDDQYGKEYMLLADLFELRLGKR